MPKASAHLCNRCRAIVNGPCPTCTTGWTARPTRRRTLPTSHRRWRTIRAGILNAEPICRVCHLRLAVEVDHIRPIALGGSETDEDNLQPICDPCHRAKTQAESKGARP